VAILQGTSSRNHLLAALSRPDRERLLKRAMYVKLKLSSVLCDAGERIRHVYFPDTGFISLVTGSGNTPPLEVGLVGDEGMLGASLLLGIQTAPLQGMVQGAGQAWRIDASQFLQACRESAQLRKQVLRYIYVSLTHLAQTTACTRFHVVESRLARWLLMTRDRAHADHFRITHLFLARILGVRRAGITRAASKLKQRNLISYARGELRIVDGHGLERASCSCYAADKDSYSSTMVQKGRVAGNTIQHRAPQRNKVVVPSTTQPTPAL
jgi:CRP-like cAMP-binding protein